MLHSYPLADFHRVRDTVLVNSHVESKFSLPWSSLSGLLWHSVSVVSIVSCGQRIILVGVSDNWCMHWWLWSHSYRSNGFSAAVSPSGNIWLWLPFLHLHHGSCWPVGNPSTCSCPVHLLFCLFTAQPIQPGPSSLSLQPFSHPYPVTRTSRYPCSRPWWDGSVKRCLTNSWDIARCHPCTPKGRWYLLLMTSWLSWVKQNSSGDSALLWYVAYFVVMCVTDCLVDGVQCHFPQSHWISDEYN